MIKTATRPDSEVAIIQRKPSLLYKFEGHSYMEIIVFSPGFVLCLYLFDVGVGCGLNGLKIHLTTILAPSPCNRFRLH